MVSKSCCVAQLVDHVYSVSEIRESSIPPCRACLLIIGKPQSILFFCLQASSRHAYTETSVSRLCMSMFFKNSSTSRRSPLRRVSGYGLSLYPFTGPLPFSSALLFRNSAISLALLEQSASCSLHTRSHQS